MIQAMIKLKEHEDRVLNIVKGKFGLRNKSEAVSLIIDRFEKKFLEPELRPEYVEKLQSLEKEKGIPFKDIKELRRVIEG